ncbi:MAG: HAMP domain-containing sensor histidine kinase [Flavobacteriales bacterium]|nr:HAMP domain-containing histidine kinase [Flavobacteriales bacterium]
MTDRSHRRTMLLFGALAVYIVLQFTWWGVLLLRKDSEVAHLAAVVKALGGNPGDHMDTYRGLRMVLGEGLVFLLILFAVLALTFSAIKRDLALARTQRNFLMAVTHELRTPIAAIKLQLQTLARTELNAEQRNLLRSQAILEADRLSLLTDKVLLATRADEGILTLEHVPLDVMKLLRSVIERARVQFAPGHEMILHGPPEHIIRSDAQAIRSIADNLIENAAKYAPQGTTITLEVIRGQEGWRLTVADEGPGISEAERDLVFTKFYRSGNEETRSSKGTGLGLYIVQRLTGQLGGTVHVRKREPRGAIFTASFPNR